MFTEDLENTEKAKYWKKNHQEPCVQEIIFNIMVPLYTDRKKCKYCFVFQVFS